MGSKKCKHCKRRATRPRQLCHSCFEDRNIRNKYPLIGKFYQHERLPILDGPTSYPPGSPGKLWVMSLRADWGLPLDHPGDVRD